MRLKCGLVLVHAAMLAGAFGASMTGTDSFAVGKYAGLDADANRTVAIGIGAGAYMTGGDSNLFVGAAAGLRTKDVKSSVGLGHYAFRGATNCTRCVGIGDLAFKNAVGLTDATWINGQFCATGGVFWISANPTTAPENAPIWYDGYTLHLNATSSGNTVTYTQVMGFGALIDVESPILKTGLRYDPSTTYHYFGGDPGTPSGDQAVYLRNNNDTIEVWQGQTKLGALNLSE